ncbi:zinc knuckle CX2CX4HX4C containing protein [Tanacetum coccineum]
MKDIISHECRIQVDKSIRFGRWLLLRVGMQLRSSPKVSTSSTLVSPSTIINVPREPYSIDVAATFGVLYADDSINLNVDESTTPSDPIVQFVDINKSTSYAGVTGGSTKDQPNVIQLSYLGDPVFDGVTTSLFLAKLLRRNNWVKHGLKRIMMNSKGFFFFKFDSRAGLEAVLEGGPWLIRKSPIILKKWSMDTRLLKEELTRIPIWVKLHDVPIQVFEEDGISLIATFIGKPVMLDSYTAPCVMIHGGRSSFARCLIKVNSEADLVDVVTIGIPSLSEDDFTKETIRVEYEWRPPRCDTCKIFGHVHDYCPKKVASPLLQRKGKSKSTNGGQFTGPSVKHNVRYEPKATTSAPMEGNYLYNLSMSNSFSALNEEEEEDEEEVENVYDESANLIQNTKAGGSSSLRILVLACLSYVMCYSCKLVCFRVVRSL